ncbi:MAG: GNAT family N-acetyltransferase [Firmicutes bacterium]|nr:GNAT family N-acetyltransferase [Bacillota bacterium]
MDNFADERDYQALESDKYTFAVLRRVIGGSCERLLTDHSRRILCYSTSPYPVWIWTADDASQAEMESVYRLAAENGFLNGEYRFNLKYSMAAYFIKRAALDGKRLAITMNMLAYDCPQPIRPERLADGALYRCVDADAETLADFLEAFHAQTGTDQRDRAGYRANAEASIRAGKVFFWRNAGGRAVACCSLTLDSPAAAVGMVYTHPDFRRRHYAESMVYAITDMAVRAGYTPMLNTNADYPASNACYRKLGYIARGGLCTIGADGKESRQTY